MKSTFNTRRRNRSNLTVISWNANGIRSRIEEFRSFIADWNPDIVNLQETHLQPPHSFLFSDYSIYKTDRTFRGGGTDSTFRGGTDSTFRGGGKAITKLSLTTIALKPPPLNSSDRMINHPLTQPGTLIRRFCDRTGYSLIAPPEPTHFHRSSRSTTIDIAICKVMTVTDCSSIPELSSDLNAVLFEVSLDNYTSPALSTYSFPNWYKNSRKFSLTPFQGILKSPTLTT
ncbi:putative RNA-directed DNA polymerase from transposon X-element [Trichonephila clavipes]|nr:putative RNA-directed DNA polymerase from transposon X-element [Trichonephila clavipes]